MTVILTATARRHLRETFRYIRKRSPQNAVLVRRRVADFLILLSSMPHIGKPGRVGGTREYAIPKTSQLLVYSVEADQIDVLGIYHQSQQWDEWDLLDDYE